MQISGLNLSPINDITKLAMDNNQDPSNDFLRQMQSSDAPESPDELKTAFRKFVGTTLYGQMLKSMRSTIGKPAYLHGGQTEEIFQQQLDQIMVEDLTEKSADTIADPMYELFSMRRAG
jgi:Rod binding domain-containing protein